MKADHQKAGSPTGFTLIELLAVIAVIAVLASLLLPALARVKSYGHSARCKSNLHQIGVALTMYVNYFDQALEDSHLKRAGSPSS